MELREYLPGAVEEIAEFCALMTAQQPEVNGLWERIYTALENQFVMTADEQTVARLEGILQIQPPATATLEERRFAILVRFAQLLPFTLRTLTATLTDLLGPGNFVIHSFLLREYILQINLARQSAFMMHELHRLLYLVIPCNLVINIGTEFTRQGGLRGYRHSELRQYSHYQIRYEVL